MARLPNNLTRYRGTTPIGVRDAAGNFFHAIQGPNNTGYCIMEKPNGETAIIPTPPIQGRPGLIADPFAGAWVEGNQEGDDNDTPPRYPIAAFVPYRLPSGPAAPGSVIPEAAAPLPNDGRAYGSNVEVFGNGQLTGASSWADYLRAGMFVLRFNKAVAALAQLQRLARQAGWIKE